MKILVLGAGVAGITAAYYLARNGHQVEIIDQAERLADGASHANGGQLSYSYTDAWARPEMLGKLPGMLAGRDLGVVVRPSMELLRWGLRFLGQCTRRRAAFNSRALLKLALRSGSLLESLRAELGIEFGWRRAGKLVLLRQPEELDAAAEAAANKSSSGCPVWILDSAGAMEREPALKFMTGDYIGALWAAGDEVADARRFCEVLAQYLASEHDVTLRLGSPVDGLSVDSQYKLNVHVDQQIIAADSVVVCLGSSSARLLRPLGLAPPIYPVRGYSITLPAAARSPQVSLTDLKHKIVFSRLNGKVRIAGFTDMVGHRANPVDQRIADLLRTARALAPEAADYDASDTRPWSGLRPTTPDGLPRVGATRIPGLFLNTGHGSLGWTLACATGHDVAQAIQEHAR